MTKCLSLLLTLWLSAATAQTQTAPPQTEAGAGPRQIGEAASQEKEPGRIEGSVVLADSDTPIRRARLVLNGENERKPLAAITGADGKFLFKHIPPGRYVLQAQHTRYLSVDEHPGIPARRDITVSEGEVVGKVTIEMVPGAVVTGRVFDEYGDPQPRASVTLYKQVYREGEKQLMPFGGVDTSDDRGQYRIFGVPPGWYYLGLEYREQSWHAARIAQPRNEQETAYPPVYYPGVLDPEAATVLDLKPGEVLEGLDLRLVLDRAVRVSGRVLEGGQPARGASVFLETNKRVSRFWRMSQTTDPKTGRFEFSGVRPGQYLLAARKRVGGPTDELIGLRDIEVGPSNVEGIVIALSPTMRIAGEVHVEGDDAASYRLGERPLRVVLMPAGGRGAVTGNPGRVNGDGSFAIEGVSGGTYTVRTYPSPKDGYLARVVFGDQDITGKEFEIRPGAEELLRLHVRLAAATIKGTVKDDDGQPEANVHVLVAPERSKWNRQELFRLEVTDQHGSFSARNLAPGEYRVWALSGAWVELGQFYYPDFLAAILPKGEKIEADEKGIYDIDLEVTKVPESW